MTTQNNPLLEVWDTPFEIPPFQDIQSLHFVGAFEHAISQHRTEIEAIADSHEPPDFKNTLIALESAGRLLERTSSLFSNLVASHSSPELRAIQREMAPKLAAHHAAMFLNEKLYRRIAAVGDSAEAQQLDPESRRLLERYDLDFVRAGARLPAESRAQFAANAQRLAVCFTQFSQNLLADESGFSLVLRSPEELSGLPGFVLEAAKAAARERGIADHDAHVITLSRSSLTPFMTFSERRDLRETLWRAWCGRGEHEGAQDNRPIIREILTLRLDQARLLGYPTFGEFALADTMAGRPEAVRDLLMRAWQPARLRAIEERNDLAALATQHTGHPHAPEDIQAWDWHYWTEKVRQAKFNLDETQLKPYLQLDRLIQALFEVAHRLFGLKFQLRSDLHGYHPSVSCWEVTDLADTHIGLFLSDNFARSTKRSGAWMSTFRGQSHLQQAVRPIVVNNNNFAQAPADKPTLLSLDDARTLFHEFGHGLHGLLSQCRFPRLSGTSVLRDFVEFPSQILENWLLQPEVLKGYATHCETGEAMPDALIEQILKAQTFNQGFATVEYLASALVDLDLHAHTTPESLDLLEFEQQTLSELQMPSGIGMRHRLPHFSHLFSSNGYASAYYVYLWAEVLEADGFAAFTEAGNIFDQALGKSLQENVFSAGNRQDPMQAYMAFRGRPPAVDPMLRKRGLLAG